MKEYIERFNVIHKKNNSQVMDSKRLGGKAYGLYILNRNGFLIPETLVIPVGETYDTYIYEKVLEFADKILRTDKNAVFSVRSSGCMEDNEQTSFAGMYETFLNVKRSELDAAIQKCYDSATSNRIEDYGKLMGVAKQQRMSMAVIVQRMIRADMAGVLFTANPISNNKKEIVIETTKGTGEKLVSGLVTPDFYQVCKKTGEVLEYAPGDEEGAELNKEITEALRIDAEKVVNCFKSEMDIEFSIVQDKVVYLQARSITSIY